MKKFEFYEIQLAIHGINAVLGCVLLNTLVALLEDHGNELGDARITLPSEIRLTVLVGSLLSCCMLYISFRYGREPKLRPNMLFLYWNCAALVITFYIVAVTKTQEQLTLVDKATDSSRALDFEKAWIVSKIQNFALSSYVFCCSGCDTNGTLCESDIKTNFCTFEGEECSKVQVCGLENSFSNCVVSISILQKTLGNFDATLCSLLKEDNVVGSVSHNGCGSGLVDLYVSDFIGSLFSWIPTWLIILPYPSEFSNRMQDKLK
eukprot:snap_masked-scaffold_15-processed-gene-7.19-mRNA-1 protein AED:1.00 eAED:1.00 QI:0/0/0/0/1/1/2/0/262